MRIEVRDFAVRYPTRTRPVLDDLSLAIQPGERILLAGPSGAGKSTLALAIAGLVPASVDAEIRGAVILDGVATTDPDAGAVASQVGLLFQDPRSQFVMPRIEDDVAFGLENHAWPTETMGETVAAALESVGLLAKRSWRPTDLSGGEQQRAALAGSLAMVPRALILDEPSTHLDPRSAIDLYDRVAALVRDRRRTLVVIEHDLDRVVGGLVERCLVLDQNGRIVLDGPLGEIFGDPDRARSCADLGIEPPTPARLALALADGAGALPLDPAAAARWIRADERRLKRLRRAAKPIGPPTPGPVRVVARELAVEYARPARVVAAVRGVSLQVRAGEVVAVLGPNGSGKSTLLRALTGLVPLADGTVTIDGVALDAGRPSPAEVGHVFQNPEAGFLAESVYDEVAFGPRALGWPAERIESATQAVLERFGLGHLAAASPFRLSAGQQRRLSLAAAVVTRPATLALDEPTAGLDAPARRTVVSLIRSLAREGTAVLVATHDGNLVADAADRVIAMRDGQIVADRPVEAFFRDEALLASVGHVRPGLMVVLDELRRLGADVPVWIRWSSLERLEAGAVAEPWAQSSPIEVRTRTVVAGTLPGRPRPSEVAQTRAGEPGAQAILGSETGSTAVRPRETDRGRSSRVGARSSTIPWSSASSAAAVVGLFWHAEVDSWLQRRNPATKLVAHLVLTLLLTLVFDPITPLIFLVGTLVAGRVLAGVAVGRQVRLLVPFWTLGLAVLLSNALFANDPRGATVLVALGPVRATVEGALIGLSLAERMVAVASLSVLFVMTTEPSDLVRSLVQQLRLAPRIAYPMLAAYLFLPILADEYETIRLAQRLRARRTAGDDNGAPGGRFRYGFLGAIARRSWAIRLLLTAAIRRTERVALAMDARGFARTAPRTHYRCLRIEPADVGLVLGALLVGGAVLGVSSMLGILRLWTGALAT